MKLVFCGPPHSGKSVFIANIVNNLPTDCYTIIRACPDGEGTWSNNKNQKEINLVRKKGKFTKSFIDNVCNAIDVQANKLIIVDVGGIMSEENKKIFKHCDNFIVLSSDEQKKKDWVKFGEELGLQCLGCIDSKLEGKEEIYSKEPYIEGRITGLERGKFLQNSELLSSIVCDILKRINYLEKKESIKKENQSIIDNNELGFKLGYGKTTFTQDGIQIDSIKWQTNAISKIYELVKSEIQENKEIKINGVRANFILTSLCKALKNKGIKDISVYDTRFNEYIKLKQLDKRRGITEFEGLSYDLIENKKNIFINIDIMKEQYTLEDYKKCILPKINEKKDLYISARIPHWLLASITNSYNSNRIFTFQPGNGFTCISSKDEKELGTLVDGIDGIDINRYFEDKKRNRDNTGITKLPNQSFMSKITNLLKKINKHNNKKKYVDYCIKSEHIEFEESAKDPMRSELLTNINQNIVKYIEEYNKSKDNSKQNIERKKDDTVI